jgi:hypothetical protein
MFDSEVIFLVGVAFEIGCIVHAELRFFKELILVGFFESSESFFGELVLELFLFLIVSRVF